MNIVVTGPDGVDYMQTDDFKLNLQYGEKNDFELTLDETLEPMSMFHVDGTPYGGIVDKRCPKSTIDGESIVYKGRSMQGILASKIIMPPTGKTHLTVSGDANDVIATVLDAVGLNGVFEAEESPSGAILSGYSFYRFVDAYSGLRMALSQAGMRLSLTCRQGKHLLQAIPSTTYGQIDSEKVFFALDCEDLPVNCLVGLGKGIGLGRAISVWYADLGGVISQTQTLFGVFENAKTYQSTSDDASTLPAKVKAKLREYQQKSAAKVTLPEGAELDIGDSVVLSSAAYNIQATTQVIGVGLKAADGASTTSYDFGMPIFPEEED